MFDPYLINAHNYGDYVYSLIELHSNKNTCTITKLIPSTACNNRMVNSD